MYLRPREGGQYDRDGPRFQGVNAYHGRQASRCFHREKHAKGWVGWGRVAGAARRSRLRRGGFSIGDRCSTKGSTCVILDLW